MYGTRCLIRMRTSALTKRIEILSGPDISLSPHLLRRRVERTYLVIQPNCALVTNQSRLCREFMICPLPRASEVSALRESRLGGTCPHGGGHGLHPGGLGAGHEGTRDFPAGDERGDQLVA